MDQTQHHHRPGYLREACAEIHKAAHDFDRGRSRFGKEHLERALQLIDDWIESEEEDGLK